MERSTEVVGRRDELRSVAAALAAAQPVVVTGEAGVGKTTVIRRAAADTRRRTFFGGAWSTLTWMEHLPLERALGRAVRGFDAAAVAADVEDAVGRGVLVLDDLQWADAQTLAAVSVLAGRISIVAGLRSTDPAAPAIADALRSAGFASVDLGALGRDDAAELARRCRPDLTTGALDRLIHDTGGNPFLIGELASTGTPSGSLRAAVAARLRLLDTRGGRASSSSRRPGARCTSTSSAAPGRRRWWKQRSETWRAPP